MAGFAIKALAVAALVCLVFDNASVAEVDDTGAYEADTDDDAAAAVAAAGPPLPTPPTLMDRMSGVMDSVKQQAKETLDADAVPMLNRPSHSTGAVAAAAAGAGSADGVGVGVRGGGGGGGGGSRVADNRLLSENALGRLQQTKGRAVAAAKRVVDETVHKLTSTVDDIRRTIGGDDADDEGGDRRMSNALDGLLRAVGSESRAALDYASDVINETADRAKAAVERAQLQQQKTNRRRSGPQ